jgi:hypothetical protein
VDPSLATSAASSKPGISARSCAEQICIGSTNQLAHQCERILGSPLWLATISFERARKCGSPALSAAIEANRIPCS